MAGLLSIALLVGWFIATVWLARRLTSRLKNGPLRAVLMTLAIIALVMLPVADEIIGGFQFRALCRDNAVLKIDAEKIKGKTIRMVIEPSNKDLDNTAVRIYHSRVSYRDTVTGQELGSNSDYVAMGGKLIRALAMGHEMTPLTIHPSTCRGPGSLPTSEKYEFKFEPKLKGVMK